MNAKLPPASTLYAFEAAARHDSFSRAAEELGVTQPAISRAVGNLESALGEKLFIRSGPRVCLTKSGSELGSILSSTFSSIEQLVKTWETRRSGRTSVLLSVSSSMAAHWLIPRMFEFHQDFPEIDLRFELISGGVGGSAVTADLGLRRSNVASPSQDATLFIEEIIQPVASLEYITRMGNLDSPRTKQPHTLIALSDHWCDWQKFASLAGFELPRDYKLMTFSDYSVALESALGGQGIVMGWLSVTSRLLATRRLFGASDHAVNTQATFNLIPQIGQENNPVVTRLRDWMRAQMALDIMKIRSSLPSHTFMRKITLPGSQRVASP